MSFKKIIMAALVATFGTVGIAETQSDSGNIAVEEQQAPKKKKRLDSFFDSMGLTNSRSYYQEVDMDKWANGWIAQSYLAETVDDANVPNDSMLMDRWLDHNNGIWSTDHLFAFDSARSYLYSAAILRSAAIKIDKPGRYRLRLYTDRFDSKGQQACLRRVAIDGATVIDEDTPMRNLGARLMKGVSDANRYHESQLSASPVMDIQQAGMYRIDFYSFCRDVSNQMEIFKYAFQYGNLTAGSCGMSATRTLFDVCIKRGVSFYGGNDLLRSENETRFGVSPLKTAISNNHGTVFQFALENMDSEKIRPLTRDDFWHLKTDTPPKNPFKKEMKAPKVVRLASETWRFWAYRDRLTNNYSFEQPEGAIPRWASAMAAVTPMIGLPDYMVAERKIVIPEDGIWGIAVGYEPSDFTMKDNNLYNSKEGKRVFIGFGVMAEIARFKKEAQKRPVSEYIDFAIHKELPIEQCAANNIPTNKNGSCSINIPLVDGYMTGAMSIGQLKVNWINLPAGEYKLVQKRNLEDIQPYVDDRNGTVNATSIASNSGYSIFLKGPSDESFYKIR